MIGRLVFIRIVLAWLAGLFLSAAASLPAAAGCTLTYVDNFPYSVCEFDPRTTHLATYNLDKSGVPLGNFNALSFMLSAEGKKLIFAMNAGMFGQDLRPIGLYIENGALVKKINRRNGGGNFHLKPNGVFFLQNGQAQVMESEAYVKLQAMPEFATQSGPMLVIEGDIHPKFSPTGASAKIRNGAGVRADGTVVFVMAEAPVNFYRFAALFRDTLACPNALFFDGSVSSLYSSELNRNDQLVPLGPMVGAYEIK